MTDMPARALVEELRVQGFTVATCESLTAGLCAASIAEVPGASMVLRGGLITYATELKHTLAGVPEDILTDHGPVAEKTAKHMAAGAALRCGADLGIALTGVAGPDTQDGHPVGEIWIGLWMQAHGAVAHRLALSGSREVIRRGAVNSALALAEDIVRVPREQRDRMER